MERARGQGTLSLCIGVLLTLAAVSASAQSARRRNWVPSGNFSPVLLGDLWSFKCPAGGYFGIIVDTMNDTNNGTSNLDPVVEVVDSKGNFLDYGDDEIACTYAPACGIGQCPVVGYTPCGSGTHTVAVGSYDFGGCTGGGGYEIELFILDKNFNLVADSKTAFGGGAKVKSPKWATGLGKTAPVIDDSVLPSLTWTIPDPTLTELESDEIETDAEQGEEVESGEEAARNSEAKKAEAVRALAAKRGEAAPPHR